MITYKPLMETLSKRGKDVYWLQREIGSHDLRAILNSNRYLSLKTVDTICKVLNCTVSRVVEWEEGEQPIKDFVRKRYYVINEDVVRGLLKDMDKSEFDCGVEMGHSPTYLNSVFQRKRVGYRVMRQLVDYFGVDSNTLCKK